MKTMQRQRDGRLPIMGTIPKNFTLSQSGIKTSNITQFLRGFVLNKYSLSFNGNSKLGIMPVTRTDSTSCPDNCSLKGSGCYAESGHMVMHWRKVSEANGRTPYQGTATGLSLQELARYIAGFGTGMLWRHNEAGDLSHIDQAICSDTLSAIVTANAAAGARGYTYTHHRVIGNDATAKHNRNMVSKANARGFTINLSADTIAQADELRALNVGPVVVILPEDAPLQQSTPAGNVITVCPAVSRGITCQQCQLCAVPTRRGIVGFPVHGAGKKKAARVFMMRQA